MTVSIVEETRKALLPWQREKTGKDTCEILVFPIHEGEKLYDITNRNSHGQDRAQ
jgi:hypothetical protein